MDRRDHLKFCRTCVNRQFDVGQGLVCKLTGKIADFEESCTPYLKDETVWTEEAAIEKEKQQQREKKKKKAEAARKPKIRVREKLPKEMNRAG